MNCIIYLVAVFGFFCAGLAIIGVAGAYVFSQKKQWLLFPIAIIAFLMFFNYFDGVNSGLQECKAHPQVGSRRVAKHSQSAKKIHGHYKRLDSDVHEKTEGRT